LTDKEGNSIVFIRSSNIASEALDVKVGGEGTLPLELIEANTKDAAMFLQAYVEQQVTRHKLKYNRLFLTVWF